MGDRQAVQPAQSIAARLPGVRRACLGQRALGVQRDDRIDRGIDALDLFQVRLHHLGGGNLLRADHGCEFGGGKKVEFLCHVFPG